MQWELLFFLDSVILGVVFYVIYDVIKSIRNVWKHSQGFIAIEDFIYWVASGVYIFCYLYEKNYGILRIYEVIAMLIGSVVYGCFISCFFEKALTWLLCIFRKFFAIPLKWCKCILKRMKNLLKKKCARVKISIKKHCKRKEVDKEEKDGKKKRAKSKERDEHGKEQKPSQHKELPKESKQKQHDRRGTGKRKQSKEN